MITARHLTKRYRKKTAVDDLSFSVNTGRVTGFLGPNGAGKSTTMRLVLGLDNGKGTTLFDGKHLYEYARPASVVGILLEAKAFHPTRSARSHLRVLADAAGVPLQRVDEVLELVGLQNVAKKGPGKFSLGMSQRLGIAAAILSKPKYLVLDEPANGLDPEGIAWLRTFLKEYAAEGNGVLVSSHLLSEMALIADDIVVIGKGKLIAETTVKKLTGANSRAGVFVRAASSAKLKAALAKENILAVAAGDGFTVSGKTTDQLGTLLFRAGVPVLELSKKTATLEEAFLDLTASSEEFVMKDKEVQS